jgi:uncharacterized protein (TIGR02270 family)
MRSEPPEPIRDILEEHLEEAAFLWTQREAALRSPRFTIEAVADGPEERLFAHLAGLALGGTAVEETLLAPALADGDAAVVAVAAAALAERGRLDLVRGALTPDAPELALAIGRALALRPPVGIEGQLAPWLEEAEPTAAAVALSVLSRRGAASEPALRRALSSPDPLLLEAGLRAAPAMGEGCRVEVERGYDAASPRIHDAAVEAGLAIGLRSAWFACRRAADEGSPTAQDLMVLAGSGERADLDRIVTAAALPGLRAEALFAAGFSGWAGAAELSVGWLGDRSFAGVAGEAFGRVTGLAIEGLYEAAAPDEADPEEEQAVPASELPIPDAVEVADWWRGNRARFPEGQRFVDGRPYGPDELLRAFLRGNTRARGPLARELAIRSRGQYRIDVDAPAGDQLRSQRTLQLVARADFGGALERILRA